MRVLVVVMLLLRSADADVRLYSDAEIARAKGAEAKQLEATAKRTCKRPVLDGKPAPGTANADLLAVAEPKDQLGACTEKVRVVAKGKQFPKLVEARDAAVLELDKSCGASFEAAIRTAIGHEDACSPYQIGQRVLPDRAAEVLQIVMLMGLRGSLRAEAGDVAGGLDLVTATMRFAQDFGRGDVGWIPFQIGSAAISLIVDDARVMLERQRPDAPALATFAARLDVLRATDPPVDDAIASERESFALYLGRAALESQAWVPPGGWPDGLSQPQVGAGSRLDQRDLGALLLSAADAIGRLTQACRRTTLAGCHTALARVKAPPDGGDASAVFDALVDKGGANPKKMRTEIVRQLAATAVAEYVGYVARRARGAAALAALRLHVEILRGAGCPTVAALAKPPFVRFARPSILGAGLTIIKEEKGLTLALPTFVASSPNWPYKLTCP